MRNSELIKIYVCKIEKRLNDHSFNEYLYSLPRVLKDRVLRFHRWEDAHASLFGKLLLKKALEDLGTGFTLTDLKYSSFNRPYIHPSFDFNISHSGKYVVCALSSIGVIGIDIELICPIDLSDFTGIFSPEEFDEILNSVDRYTHFYDYWTMKEAVLKAEGSGLSISPRHVRIEGRKSLIRGRLWHLHKIPIDRNYALHIASDNEIAEKIETSACSFTCASKRLDI